MNAPFIADLAIRPRSESGWRRLIAAAGWPILGGCAAFVLGLLMMAAAAVYNHQARQMASSSTPIAAAPAVATGTPGQAPANDAFVSQLPLDATHLDDVSWIFKIAKEQGINLGAITYRAETIGAIPVVVRSMDVRVDEEYPKLKAFVAQLLRDLPHLSLNEIRVEQANAQAAKLQATLDLSLIYRKGGQ